MKKKDKLFRNSTLFLDLRRSSFLCICSIYLNDKKISSKFDFSLIAVQQERQPNCNQVSLSRAAFPEYHYLYPSRPGMVFHPEPRSRMGHLSPPKYENRHDRRYIVSDTKRFDGTSSEGRCFWIY